MLAARGQASLSVSGLGAGNPAPLEAAQLFLVTPELLILSTPAKAELGPPFDSDTFAKVGARCPLWLHPLLSSRWKL
jgi:hypothetical protein